MSESRKAGRLTNFFRPFASDECASVDSGARMDVWERWHLGSLYAFYVLLGMAVVLSVANGEISASERFAVAGLSFLLAGWHYAAAHRRTAALYGNVPAIIVYFVVILALLAPLIRMAPTFSLMAFIIFWMNFSLWRLRYSIPGAIVGSIYMPWMNSDSANPLDIVLTPEIIGTIAVTVPIMVALSLFIASIIRQSRERQTLIEELEETRKSLAAEERRAGVLEERDRLAKEIHDTLAQGFISIVTHLEAAEEDDEVSPEARRHLDQAKRTARENLVEARRLVAALRPEILESSSLPNALERLAENCSEASGISVELNVTGDDTHLPQELQVTLLRAAQEALSNVRRHAAAKEVSMTLSYAGDLVLLDVNDDGRGFDVEMEPEGSDGGFGLRAMRERVERHGGTLAIESSPGEGTTLAVQIPIGAERTVEAR